MDNTNLVRSILNTIPIKDINYKEVITTSLYDTAKIGLTYLENNKIDKAEDILDSLISNYSSDNNNVNYPPNNLINNLSFLKFITKMSKEVRIDNELIYSVQRDVRRDINLHSFFDNQDPVGYEIVARGVKFDDNEIRPRSRRYFYELNSKSARKLSILNKFISSGYIYSKRSTVLHNLEMFDENLLDFNKLVETTILHDKNNAFLSSPSSTIYTYAKAGRIDDNEYINSFDHRKGYPVNFPIDAFEANWIIEIILNLGLEYTYDKEIIKLLNMLYFAIKDNNNKGLAWSTTFKDGPADLDDTAAVFIAFRKFGFPVSTEMFNQFIDENLNLFCFPGEIGGSPSHIARFVRAFNYMSNSEKVKFQAVRDKALEYLNEVIVRERYQDKWHLSKIYTIATLLPALTESNRLSLVKKLTSDLFRYQNFDGGWGEATFGISNPEETAWGIYCLYYLEEKGVFYDDRNKKMIINAKNWFTNNPVESHNLQPLWIDKVLYTPKRIVNTLINLVTAI